MTKLFKNKEPALLQSARFTLRVTESESEQIRQAARIRQMDVNEYIRRAALGRKADVDYETETVLALMNVGRDIRKLYAVLVERGIPPLKEDMQPIVDHAIAAIIRISK